MKSIRYTLLLSLIFSGFCLSVKGQQKEEKPNIALLGTFHFAGSSDLLSMKVDDLRSEKRQKEIADLVRALKQFRPTRVVVEYPYHKRDKIDSLYQLFLKGDFELAINERQQLGFRLAADMGHEHVYAADHYADLPFDELMTFLQAEGKMQEFEKMIRFMKDSVITKQENFLKTHTLKELFVTLNSPEFDEMNKNAYLEQFSKFVSEDNDIGIRLVSRWWDRNFRIMSNIDKIMRPGDRVLVIFGQGHTALLKGFYQTRTDVIYVDLLPLLR